MPGSLVGTKIKQLALNDVSADGSAKLVLLQGRPRDSVSIEEKIVGVEDVVAKKFKQCAMELVASRFGHHVDVAAGASPVGGVIQTRLHFEFLDGIGIGNGNAADRQNAAGPLRLHIARVLTIHLVAVVHDAAAVDEYVYRILTEAGGIRHRTRNARGKIED